HEFAVRGTRENLAETVATVGERAQIEGPVGTPLPQCFGRDRTRFARGQRTLEFVEDDQDVHGAKKTDHRKAGHRKYKKPKLANPLGYILYGLRAFLWPTLRSFQASRWRAGRDSNRRRLASQVAPRRVFKSYGTSAFAMPRLAPGFIPLGAPGRHRARSG